MCMPEISLPLFFFNFIFFPFLFVCLVFLFKVSFVKMFEVLFFIIQNKKLECTLSASSIFHLTNIAFPHAINPHYTLSFLSQLTINVVCYFTSR